MSWLDPVRAALAAEPAPVFFRDDDAGWADDRLRALLDRFDAHGRPVDVAVIPTELTASLAAELRARSGLVHLHQHGYAHVDHEPSGRKHEFGPSRTAASQTADIAAGRTILRDAFGDRLDPVFTPPWNRCTDATAAACAAAGITVLSRDSTAAPLVTDLVQVPVTVDWFGHRKGVRWSRAELATRIATGLAGPGPVGIMLHHAVTDDAELAAIDELLDVLATHPATRSTSLADYCR